MAFQPGGWNPQKPQLVDPFGLGEMSPERIEQLGLLLQRWARNPVYFVTEAMGGTPDPWQCDVMDALMEYDNVAVRACHGVGKTALIAWIVTQFTTMRPFSKVPVTAPTFNKQVKDIIWAEIHRWWREFELKTPWLTNQWELQTTLLRNRKHKEEWFSVGIASNQPINAEGYHAPHLLAVFDEAKGIKKPTWDAIHGMRTTQVGKLFVASTPGGPMGEFFKVFTRYRQTWPSLFIIHPESLREQLKRPEAKGVSPVTGKATVGKYAKGGTYYSKRVRKEWVEERAKEWGKDSPVFIARCIGDFPSIEGDALIPYGHISEAMDREEGIQGPCWVGCDVARYGADRTVAFVASGGTIVHGESIARSAAESTAPEVQEFGVGADPKRPRYRSELVTAEMLYRLVIDYGAEGAIVDDTGLGGGVVTILQAMGIKVIPISFGVPPTDRPRSPELVKLKKARNQPESIFMNIKMQMAWALRSAFESGAIALGALDDALKDPLVAQLSLVKAVMNDQGRLKLVDPDELEDEDSWASILGSEERHKSPDHFHALLLAWWMAGTAAPFLMPKAKGILPGQIRQIGRLRGGSPQEQGGVPAPVAATMLGKIAGPGRFLGGLYRSGR